MNVTARRRPMNDNFKQSQPLPELPTTNAAAKSPARPAKQPHKAELPSRSIRAPLIRSFAFSAAFFLLVTVSLTFPAPNEELNARPRMTPTTAAWENPWHRNHHPWNTLPIHHLPAQPTDHSLDI